jgi:uncharacterized protein (TIGR00251 family)
MTIRIQIYVQTRASKTEIAGMHDGRIKVRLAAPPVDGAANAELIEFIAGTLGIAKSRVRIVAGATGRRKVLEVDDVTEQTVREQLC